jgi:DNA-binding transcriptional LysR family regulator
VRSLDAVVQLVADGVGVAVIPEHAARRMATPQAIQCVLADPWATRHLLLCTAPDAPGGTAAAELLRFLVDSAGDSRAAIRAGAMADSSRGRPLAA